MRRLRNTVLVVLALGLLGLGHWAWWYRPRPRPASPDPGSLTWRLAQSDAFPYAVWVPYPHQNLGALHAATPDADALIDAAARLAGLPQPVRPAFGPLSVPPATSLAAASTSDGQEFAVFAEVYPAVAAFARLSGRLAGNPWLEGGEAVRHGRRVEVAWHGNTWTVTSGGFPRLAETAGERIDGALLVGEVRHGSKTLAADRYVLRATAGGAEIRSRRPFPDELGLDAGAYPELGLFLLVVEDLDTARGLAFFSQDAGNDLPRAAVFYRPGEERWSLPGEGLLGLVRRDPREARAGGWSVAALDRTSLENGRRLAAGLEPWVTGNAVATLAWVDLAGAKAEVSRIAAIFDRIPLVSPERRRHWHDVETVLEGLSRRYSRLEVVELDGGAMRVRVSESPSP